MVTLYLSKNYRVKNAELIEEYIEVKLKLELKIKLKMKPKMNLRMKIKLKMKPRMKLKVVHNLCKMAKKMDVLKK